jgi:GNAT superfamily N-acetyltransferase
MRAQEFIAESQTASADVVWNYVKRIHPAEQQGGGFLEQLIRQYPKYRLQAVPVASLVIHDQESDDPDQEPEEDPYGRVQVVDPEYAGEVSVHNLDRNPIVIDAQGHILDGNHRAWAAAELLGRDTIQAWVPVKSVTEDAFNGIDISLEIQKDDEYVDDEDYDNQVIYVTASSNGRELGHVLFAFDGEYLMPQDLEVDERYRGQGIAATMYDYVKSRGYKIRRSGQQTAAGTGFWAKHNPGQNVWEEK